ncbi:MAG: SRPBCC family protein, partial [Actinomycetota bacterium]
HKIVRWKGRSAELDPRPGGIYRVQINDEAVARGTYVEVVPHSKVVFTWGWEGDANPVVPGSSTVEVTLTPDGNGTIVRLVHRDLPVEERASHADGWKQYLGRLALVVEGKDPGPDPHAESS